MALDASLPIGVFDSGLGGLTVVSEIIRKLPAESILYLGDTARVPYGTRSPQTVIRYAQSCAKALISRGIKVLVVACNTVSAVALDVLRADLDIPVMGVILPGAKAAVSASKSLRIGVLGTAGTVNSGAYPRAVHSLSTRAEVIARAAPLLVPLVEEGWTSGEVPSLAVARYLQPLADADVDVIVLGCTHYPALKRVVVEVAHRLFSKPVSVIDSAEVTAMQLGDFLREREMQSPRLPSRGSIEILVTDRATSFADLASRLLRAPLPDVQLIDL